MLEEVYNIKDWLSPHGVELHEHTIPKSFKFTRNADGKGVMHYRNYSNMGWQGPITILQVSNMPSTSHGVCIPTY